MKKIELLDTTLREGEQSANVSFTVDQKIEILKSLDEFGVEFIEIGHPIVSPDVHDAVQKISRIETKANKLIHSRAMKEDIDLAHSFDIEWIGIFFGTSDLSLKYKFGINKSEAIKKIIDSVKYAKDKGIKLRFTAEDATRTNIDYLIEVAQSVSDAGADRFSIADTVGILTPEKTTNLVSKIVENIDIPVHIHCHNDFGLAVANSVSGLLSGAQVADVTINGIGERSGIASLAEIALLLKTQYNSENNWDLSKIYKLSKKVERMSGIFNSENKPIVGINAFTHKAGLHSRAVIKDPRTYEAFDPKIIDRSRDISIDKYSGIDALAFRLKSLNVPHNKEQLFEILKVIKSHPEKRKFNDLEILELADEILKVDIKTYVPIDVEAILNIELNSAVYTSRITRWLMSRNQVKDVYEVAGDYDIIAHINARSISDLNDIVEELRVKEGVLRTHTRPVLKGYSISQN